MWSTCPGVFFSCPVPVALFCFYLSLKSLHTTACPDVFFLCLFFLLLFYLSLKSLHTSALNDRCWGSSSQLFWYYSYLLLLLFRVHDQGCSVCVLGSRVSSLCKGVGFRGFRFRVSGLGYHRRPCRG